MISLCLHVIARFFELFCHGFGLLFWFHLFTDIDVPLPLSIIVEFVFVIGVVVKVVIIGSVVVRLSCQPEA